MSHPKVPPLAPCRLCLVILLCLLSIKSATAVRAQAAGPSGIVAVLTDFGDGYQSGALQGAILSSDPSANLVTISNDVPSFDIREGAYWLQQAAQHFPAGTVFLAIVDPSIASGTGRILVAQTDDGSLFVGPDNGLLSLALGDRTVLHAYTLTNAALMAPGTSAQPLSSGRQIYGVYAYAAGALAAGASPANAGPEITDWTKLSIPPATIDQGSLDGEVVDVDHFGNLITNIPASLVAQAGLSIGQQVTLTIGSQSIAATFVRTFSDVPAGAYLAYVDQGSLQIAINTASAAAATGAQAGQAVVVTPAPQ